MVEAETPRIALCVNEVSMAAARMIVAHGGKVRVLTSTPFVVLVTLPRNAQVEQGDAEKVVEWRITLPAGEHLDYYRSVNVCVSWIRETGRFV